MKLKNKKLLPLDKFIDFALYQEKNGYYMKKNPFGVHGDFITAPNISILFSEMICIWIISFWKKLNKPKKINIVELGAGNGEMVAQIIKTSRHFLNFSKASNFFIFEKSQYLKQIQKKKLKNTKVKWIKQINNLKKNPTIFIGNEFFDSLPVKQFIKKNNFWFEKYVDLSSKNRKFITKKIEIKKIEKKIGFNFSKNQNFIEFSPKMLNTLKSISKVIQKQNGGLLIIDYGYFDNKMFDTLQAVKNHKKTYVLNEIGETDISHKLNFNFIKKIIYKLNLKVNGISNQRNFLIKMGIMHRAEIISKNLSFLKKADIYYRVKRLTDKKQMGDLFKVMFISNKKINFNLGF